MKKLLIVLWVAALLVGTWGCFGTGPDDQASNDGGSGSEIVGVVEYPDSSAAKTGADGRVALLPVMRGPIFLFRRDAAPDTAFAFSAPSPEANTDDQGRFRLPLVGPGNWMLEATDNNGRARVKPFTVPGDGEPIDLGSLLVERTATMRTRVTLPFPSGTNLRYFLRVMGTRFVAAGTGNNVDISLYDVAPGASHDVEFRLYTPVSGFVQFSGITVNPGELVDLPDVTDLF